jgi:hypothetical protein
MYKLTVIETNISSFSGEIIFDELVECPFDIIDLKDFLLLDYLEKLNYKPIINISEKHGIKEMIIYILCNSKNYGRDIFINVLEDRVMPVKDFEIFFRTKY